MNTKKKRVSEIRLSFTLAAVIYVVLGLLLIFMPNTSRKLLCTFVGLGITAYGLLNIVSYLMSKGEQSYTFTLLLGVCALAFGVFSLINRTFLMDFLFTVIALVVIVSGVNGVRRALRLRGFGFIRWQAPLIAALVTIALSLSVIFFPGFYGNLLMMLCGILLVLSGAGDLCSIHYLNRYL